MALYVKLGSRVVATFPNTVRTVSTALREAWPRYLLARRSVQCFEEIGGRRYRLQHQTHNIGDSDPSLAKNACFNLPYDNRVIRCRYRVLCTQSSVRF